MPHNLIEILSALETRDTVLIDQTNQPKDEQVGINQNALAPMLTDKRQGIGHYELFDCRSRIFIDRTSPFSLSTLKILYSRGTEPLNALESPTIELIASTGIELLN